ncbi:hypothetical protein ASPSYDRAFT_50517 [Aspergillus sydowii CBS 593.65]|uniref:Uncharacterized protein n=1 Tax=Aspergillus sydowii CBS 593.65 TaxID=1036612 RepID=A0A1L9T393_9EURO|nr:uncharacterized protein ASPSYDRAFT_50517 [Aspergillus sydowii CBS 593.65]OJJ53763.1 hypothetical protein ASPSYDRAFT_50517 [Aspergillus sydowii CBS 593.65]
MAWSIDKSIAFITLLLTGTWSFLQIWNYVANAYRRALSQDSGIEVAVAREQDNTSPEILLESGLFNIPDQAYGLCLSLRQCYWSTRN